MEILSDQLFSEFCQGCIFLIKNAAKINNNQDLSEIIKSKTELCSINSKECKFCYGILSKNNFDKILNLIKTNILKYDYKDYKITTNFSPLLNIIHAYVS
jgi:hypothetical protein